MQLRRAKNGATECRLTFRLLRGRWSVDFVWLCVRQAVGPADLLLELSFDQSGLFFGQIMRSGSAVRTAELVRCILHAATTTGRDQIRAATGKRRGERPEVRTCGLAEGSGESRVCALGLTTTRELTDRLGEDGTFNELGDPDRALELSPAAVWDVVLPSPAAEESPSIDAERHRSSTAYAADTKHASAATHDASKQGFGPAVALVMRGPHNLKRRQNVLERAQKRSKSAANGCASCV